VARRGRLGDLALGPHLRRRTVRFRLTALYCGLFFPSAVLLVVVTYALIILVQRWGPVSWWRWWSPKSNLDLHVTTSSHGSIAGVATHAATTSTNLATATVHVEIIGHSVALDTSEFLVGSSILLVAMIGASMVLGWLVAGRVLRPLRVMTTSARQISERNLHERLALEGPDDELKDLADTIDGLLTRLEAAFESQRRFVANASHELRTPLMLSQTLLQVALADPAVTLDSLRAACQESIDAGKDQAQLIDALLTLARSQQGLDRQDPVDLTAVVDAAINAHGPSAGAGGIHVDATLDEATVSGDARLIYRLVSNIVGNAIRYNITGGRVEVKLASSSTAAMLTVTNTGPLVAPHQVSRLLQPFQRATPDRAASPDGLGLGLSIVAQIAEAHGAVLDVSPRPEGGLIVAVSFPPARTVSRRDSLQSISS
jgi:signal transduction histidine kinase